ncbi:MAG TPA: hypothetical protein VKX49_23695 [Bryobacteraceae bacterium]|nr:hypothetical protein [Bryobacteraceae bacterium]
MGVPSYPVLTPQKPDPAHAAGPGLQTNGDNTVAFSSRQEAQQAISEAVNSPREKFILLVIVSQVDILNARLGDAFGRRMLAVCADHFRTHLGCDQLYRWSETALLAILSQPERIDRLRAKIHRFADTMREETVQICDRTLLVPVTWNWSLIQVSPPLESMLAKIDLLASAPLPGKAPRAVRSARKRF